jgi:hypothetical protein
MDSIWHFLFFVRRPIGGEFGKEMEEKKKKKKTIDMTLVKSQS